jgi:hypothetical protein
MRTVAAMVIESGWSGSTPLGCRAYPLGNIVSRVCPILCYRLDSASSADQREDVVNYELYRQTIVEMEKRNVDREYVQGWAGGFMGNTKREEQRVTEPYEKGYEDGRNQDTSSFEKWISG